MNQSLRHEGRWSVGTRKIENRADSTPAAKVRTALSAFSSRGIITHCRILKAQQHAMKSKIASSLITRRHFNTI
jgi:hypothetical protein